MVARIASIASLLAFAMCLVIGGLGADNTFTTTVGRALTAMLATLVIGLALGTMAKKMLDENLKSEKEILEKNSASKAETDR